ncbi:MAG: hypothetical protein QW478_05125 [Candidatus Micrarchaeaceae archaeon]
MIEYTNSIPLTDQSSDFVNIDKLMLEVKKPIYPKDDFYLINQKFLDFFDDFKNLKINSTLIINDKQYELLNMVYFGDILDKLDVEFIIKLEILNLNEYPVFVDEIKVNRQEYQNINEKLKYYKEEIPYEYVKSLGFKIPLKYDEKIYIKVVKSWSSGRIYRLTPYVKYNNMFPLLTNNSPIYKYNENYYLYIPKYSISINLSKNLHNIDIKKIIEDLILSILFFDNEPLKVEVKLNDKALLILDIFPSPDLIAKIKNNSIYIGRSNLIV